MVEEETTDNRYVSPCFCLFNNVSLQSNDDFLFFTKNSSFVLSFKDLQFDYSDKTFKLLNIEYSRESEKRKVINLHFREEVVDLEKGDQHIMRYQPVKGLVARGSVQLI